MRIFSVSSARAPLLVSLVLCFLLCAKSAPLLAIIDILQGNELVCLPMSGAMNITMDWGDGSALENFTSAPAVCVAGVPGISHSFVSTGVKIISISRRSGYTASTWLEHFGAVNSAWKWSDKPNQKFVGVSSFGDLNIVSLWGAFRGAGAVEILPTSIPPSIVIFVETFQLCSGFNNSNITQWDMSSAYTLERMFENCPDFNVPIGVWNVSSAAEMSGTRFS